MNPIEQIEEKLREYPQVKYERNASSIRVLPASSEGFAVTIDAAPNHFTVSFNGWHEDFQQPDEALDCFAFVLSDNCRLKEFRRGRFAYRWIVESNENGEWIAVSETGLFFFQFWLAKEVLYLQNNLISSKGEITP